MTNLWSRSATTSSLTLTYTQAATCGPCLLHCTSVCFLLVTELWQEIIAGCARARLCMIDFLDWFDWSVSLSVLLENQIHRFHSFSSCVTRFPQAIVDYFSRICGTLMFLSWNEEPTEHEIQIYFHKNCTNLSNPCRARILMLSWRYHSRAAIRLFRRIRGRQTEQRVSKKSPKTSNPADLCLSLFPLRAWHNVSFPVNATLQTYAPLFLCCLLSAWVCPTHPSCFQSFVTDGFCLVMVHKSVWETVFLGGGWRRLSAIG